MSMRIAVFARPVHNPAFSIEPGAASRIEDLRGYQPIPNPQDELALEIALSLKEMDPSLVKVLVCSVGGEPARKVLQEFLACGADEAVWLDCTGWEPDGWLVARHLREFFRNTLPDLGLFGARDLDTGAGQVGPMFSAIAGIPYFDSVTAVQWDGATHIEASRKQKRLFERIRMNVPACLGIQRGKPLRYPSLWGKLRAARAEIRRVSTDPSSFGPLVERQKFAPSKPRRASTATDYAQTTTIDRIRQAYGFTGKSEKSRSDSLIRDAPEQAARRILTIWKQEKLMDLEEAPRT